MGLYDQREDALALGDYREAFELSRQILNRKGSKRLMAIELVYCIECLDKLGLCHLLPPNFDDFSVYGQRDIINRIQLPKK